MRAKYSLLLSSVFSHCNLDFIMTSLNLYDYSLAKNIEVGIRCNYASKGILGKALNSTDNLLGMGTEKVKQEILGMEKTVGPIEKFNQIFESSELKYKTEPNKVDKGGFSGLLGRKQLDGFKVVINNFENSNDSILAKSDTAKSEQIKNVSPVVANQPDTKAKTDTYIKTVSASQLSKAYGVSQIEITNLMQKKGLINGDKITDKGIEKGLLLKNYMGNNYIAYPENLPELDEIKF